VGSLESRAEDLGNVVREILKQFQSLDQQAAQGPHTHLSHQEMRVIEILGDSGMQMMRVIAAELSVAVNSLTKIIDHMEEKKLVTRVRSNSDRRVVHVKLTTEGKSACRALKKAKADFHRSILSVLTDDEQEILLVLFRKIARAGSAHQQGTSRG
jgi:DNA-binding MarR family transcriptional regulator